jgi:hypothetical protein
MAIQINLLAEAHAREERRRRDPVKRFILGGAVVVVLILVWSSSLTVKTMIAKGELNTLEGNLNSRTNEYRQILENQRRLGETREKLEALRRLAANRFLMGNLLDALQKTTLENVQLVRLKLDQTYVLTEESKTAKPPKPASATEKILLTLNAKDSSPVPGDAVNKFQQALSGAPYFREELTSATAFRLINVSPPQTDPEGKSFALFTLEAHFPEKTR